MTAGSTGRSPGTGRSLLGLSAIGLAVLGVVAIVAGLRAPGGPPASAAPDRPAATSTPATPGPTARTSAPAATGPAARSATAAPAPSRVPGTPEFTGRVEPLPRSSPVTLEIPAIGVRTRVTSLGLQPDGTVEVPSLGRNDPAGWYRYLASPGEIGPAVLLGHVDSAKHGPAVFYRLGRLRRGDSVWVTRADGMIANFAVQSISKVAKSAFPTDEVYGPTTAAEVRLITCGGPFDRRRDSYRDNIIVFATLQSVARRSS